MAQSLQRRLISQVLIHSSLPVGGTQLHADLSTGEYHDEVVWNEPDVGKNHSAVGTGWWL